MKKFLVLMLVLGLASAASATTINLSLTVGGSSSVSYTSGNTYQVDLKADQDLKAIGEIDFIVETSSNTSALGAWINGPAGGLNDPGTLTGNDILNAWYGANDLRTAGTVLYSFNVTVYANGTASIDNLSYIFDPAYVMPPTNYDIGTLSGVSFVPEPMTIALLGLGGLFLRRRK